MKKETKNNNDPKSENQNVQKPRESLGKMFWKEIPFHQRGTAESEQILS